jgi:hypothetical protein
MQDILEPLVRQALGMTMAGLRQAKGNQLLAPWPNMQLMATDIESFDRT